MKNFDFKDRDGNTPLTKEQLKGLKPDITNQGELDEFEEENITLGLSWMQKTNADYLKYDFWKTAHKRHFGNVWSWAGKIRTEQLANPYFSEPGKISNDLHKLEKDLSVWIKLDAYEPEELLARFHLRLITVHPFFNGNGRISRILTEHLSQKLGFVEPLWGQVYSKEPKLRREKYISALDKGRQGKAINDLVVFMFV